MSAIGRNSEVNRGQMPHFRKYASLALVSQGRLDRPIEHIDAGGGVTRRAGQGRQSAG
jgi:hypothetical protein